MRSLGFLFFLLFLAGLALVYLKGRDVVPPAAPGAEGPAQAAYEVVMLRAESLPEDARPRIEFGPEQRISGDSGCNLFGGRYEQNGREFAVGSLRATRKACEPPLMQREQLLFDVLAEVRRVEEDGATLHLLDESGERLAELSPLAD